MRKSVIIIQDILKVFSSEIFSNMKIACDRMGWPYSYVKNLSAPFQYKGYYINKKPVKTETA